MSLEAWLAERLGEGPAELTVRVREVLDEVPAELPLPERLARAGRAALDRAMVGGTDRGAALDLLAADSLVTLALAAQVESAPGDLASFARRVRDAAEGSA